MTHIEGSSPTSWRRSKVHNGDILYLPYLQWKRPNPQFATAAAAQAKTPPRDESRNVQHLVWPGIRTPSGHLGRATWQLRTDATDGHEDYVQGILK